MRILPKTPNLEHLKQQAKDLLAALRESQPGTTLSDAQVALARQYGFRTWAELKLDVERMRADVEPADHETASAIAKAFDLGEMTAPATLITVELGAPVMRLETERGRWSAHAVLEWMDATQVDEGARLLDAAIAAGIKGPRPVRTPSGALLEEAGGQTWRVDEWMDLGPGLVKPIPRKTARTVGEVLGTLHSLGLKPNGPMNPWIAERRDPERWQRILEAVRERNAPWAPELEAALPALIEVAGLPSEPTDEPILSHTNLPAYVRVGPAGSLAVLGWEFAGATPPSWELGYVLHACTEAPDGSLNLTAAPSIVEGYASVTGTTPTLDMSMFGSAINAADSWLVSRMNIALGGEGADREQATKELLHILSSPNRRARFEQILEAASGS